MTNFKQLSLSEPVLRVLEEMGFEEPTQIQSKSIPVLLEASRDFIGLAQTGTGKTGAFGIPLVELVDPSMSCTQALIVAPTRELGQQIAEQLNKFGKYMDKVNILCVYGGASIENQIKALKRNTQHIIVATPGRLIDLVKRKAVQLDEVNAVVLDEADEMLNMGFKEDIDQILSYTPEDKLTWLFSATMPNEIRRIVKTYMEDPFEVKINQDQTVNKNIEHQYVRVKSKDKNEALARFLDAYPNMRGVVFCRTRRDTQTVAEGLLKKKYRADALHGDLSQAQRDRVMGRFKSHDLQVLVATDVAARGIDVDDLTHVIHHSLPEDAAYYTHRSGRTARAGKKGISIAFASSRDYYRIADFERELDIKFSPIMVPGIEAIASIRLESWVNEILEAPLDKNIEPDSFELVQNALKDYTKEELISKLISLQMHKLATNSKKDLNDTSKAESKGKKKGRGGRNMSSKYGKPNQRRKGNQRRDGRGSSSRRGRRR